MTGPLRILAGSAALEVLRDRGLDLSAFGWLIAAAGGSKFLVLGGLDRVLFPLLRETPRERPLRCIGSSIGSLRLACLFGSAPHSALERVAAAYWAYERAVPVDGARFVREIVGRALEGQELAEVADPSFARYTVLATECRGLTKSDRRSLLLPALGLAAAGNALSRRTLGLQFTRVAFHSRGDAGPLSALRDLPTCHRRLTADNVEAVLIASASVPMLVPGASIPGEGRSVYRDGALLDYHPVLHHAAEELVLYPHFYPHVTPGWFDRSLPGRRARGEVLRRTVVLAPSAEFVSRLPGGAMPTRRDIRRFDDAERRRRWRAIWAHGRELGDALLDFLASPRRVSAEATLLA
ncbi:MAG TPA: hypothetical protein VHE30_06500 [Polyangiaceae bacterium]|nr:hypothetical protein [Polyangiaceae bacterium]